MVPYNIPPVMATASETVKASWGSIALEKSCQEWMITFAKMDQKLDSLREIVSENAFNESLVFASRGHHRAGGVYVWGGSPRLIGHFHR